VLGANSITPTMSVKEEEPTKKGHSIIEKDDIENLFKNILNN